MMIGNISVLWHAIIQPMIRWSKVFYFRFRQTGSPSNHLSCYAKLFQISCIFNSFFFTAFFTTFLKPFIFSSRNHTIPITEILQTVPILTQFRTGELRYLGRFKKTVEHSFLKCTGRSNKEDRLRNTNSHLSNIVSSSSSRLLNLGISR